MEDRDRAAAEAYCDIYAIIDSDCEVMEDAFLAGLAHARKEPEQLVEALRKIVARCRLEQTGPESDAIEIAREALVLYQGAAAKTQGGK